MLTFRFTGVDGQMTETETLTSGMIGKTVKLEFSEDWQGLTKTAVFTAGGITRDVVGVEDVAIIPAEVLAYPAKQLCVGVYGTSAEAGIAIPTIRAVGPVIQPGANPFGDEGVDPGIPVWAQLQEELDRLRKNGVIGQDGLSVYFADFDYPGNMNGVFGKKLSDLQLNDRQLQPGDLLISRNGVLMYVTEVTGTTYSAQKLTVLVPEIDGSTYGMWDIADRLGYGTASAPIDLSKLNITNHTTLYFSRGTYYVSPLALEGVSHLTIMAQDAVLMVAGASFITASGCHDLRMFGGELDGCSSAQYGIQLSDSENARFQGVTFRNFGSDQKENVSMLNLFGDCTGFLVEQCVFDGCTAGVVSSDGFIHAYGILVNRLGSSKTYSRNGVIRLCAVSNIAGTDNDSTKADGDGIFIQAPPYRNEAGETVIPEARIVVQNCIFTDCKKRGVKSAARGVVITDCQFRGEFWYACVDFQYGHGRLLRSKLENTSDYNGSITSAMVASDGGVVVQDCVFSAPYVYVNPETGEKTNTYHPGIRLGKRLGGSILDSTVPWDPILVDRCYFDGCSRSVFAYNSEGDTTGYVLNGLEITGCRFGRSNQAHVVELNNTMFAQIMVYRFTDFRFDAGASRRAVAEVNEAFTYPHSSNCEFVRTFELYSRYWENEPMSGYQGLPSAIHTKIIYAGVGMGTIHFKRYTNYGSLIRGRQAPESITSTLSKQLLYNSAPGDLYINISTGNLYRCTAAGTDTEIGTWTLMS